MLVVIFIVVVVVLVVAPISRRPGHLVLLLEPSARVRKPGAHLGQRHAGHHGQEDLFVLGRVGVSLVSVEPLLEQHGGLSGGVLAARLHMAVWAAGQAQREARRRRRAQPERPEAGAARHKRVGMRRRRWRRPVRVLVRERAARQVR